MTCGAGGKSLESTRGSTLTLAGRGFALAVAVLLFGVSWPSEVAATSCRDTYWVGWDSVTIDGVDAELPAVLLPVVFTSTPEGILTWDHGPGRASSATLRMPVAPGDVECTAEVQIDLSLVELVEDDQGRSR